MADGTVLLVAGEASGDMHAGALAGALLERRPGLRLLGMGGPQMKARGTDNRFPLTDVAVMGFTEVLLHAGEVWRAWRAAIDLLERERPDVVVLVDYPGFNLKLAEAAHKRGIRVVYYISPQLWAWKPGRVRTVRRCVRRMLCIVPFEVQWYARHDVDAVFVGHPLAERIPEPMAEREVGSPPTIGLLPGSRASDCRRLVPAMRDTVGLLRRDLPDTRFVVPVAETAQARWLRPLAEVGAEMVDTGYSTRAACDAAIIKSGTATVEHALLGLPSIIVYRTGALTYWIAKRVVSIDRIGMVNLIAEAEVCPELIQQEASPQRMARVALDLLANSEKRATMRAGMRRVRERLGGPGASARAAGEVLDVLDSA